jgi:tungstate transport system ATP-binding protein
MTPSSLIHLKNVVVRRSGTKVLDISDFGVQTGRILVLIGPNGAGKTTLLLTMAGLLKPTSGTIYYKGMPVISGSDRARMRRQVSVVFQEPLLLNTSVYKNVSLGLKFRKASRKEMDRDVRSALEYFGISELAERSAKTLSSGEAKRVCLARAFAIKPEIILMDEAFNSLDPPSKETLIGDLRDILEKTKITAVLILHDREETLRLAQDVIVMVDGRVIQSGTAARIYNRPETHFVAQFVGTETILEGIIERNDNDTLKINVSGKIIEAMGSLLTGQKVYCCLRPENIVVSPGKINGIDWKNVFEAKVIKMSRQSCSYKLSMDCGFPIASYLPVHLCEDLNIQEGSNVYVAFKSTSVHVIERSLNQRIHD